MAKPIKAEAWSSGTAISNEMEKHGESRHRKGLAEMREQWISYDLKS